MAISSLFGGVGGSLISGATKISDAAITAAELKNIAAQTKATVKNLDTAAKNATKTSQMLEYTTQAETANNFANKGVELSKSVKF